MANSSRFTVISSSLTVKHRDQLLRRIGDLYMKSEYSDVAIIVEGNKIPCHKVILASCSEYFSALLYGGYTESQEREIELKEVSFESFKILLKYIYSGTVDFSSLCDLVVFDVLGLANLYGLTDLESAISNYLLTTLCLNNLLMIYERASLYNISTLLEISSRVVDLYAADVMRHKSFLEISPVTLKEIISRDSFHAPEVDIFLAVCKWSEQNPSENAGDVLAEIRLPLMSVNELTQIVRPTALFTIESILDALEVQNDVKKSDVKYLNYRGCLLPDIPLPVMKATTSVYDESCCVVYDSEDNTVVTSPFSVMITDDTELLVELKQPSIINHIIFSVNVECNYQASYYIKVSVDGMSWLEVIDYRMFSCHLVQSLYFDSKVVKFIRIGGDLTVTLFDFKRNFRCLYKSNPLPQSSGIIYPTNRTVVHARVIQGLGEETSELFSKRNSEQYDFDTPYTWHKIGKNAIVIHLGQPYGLESMRMLLWDLDNRSYNYGVEVSIDRLEWYTVAQETSCQSWQVITFPRMIVCFIRITGTHSTLGREFRLLYFECPAQDSLSVP